VNISNVVSFADRVVSPDTDMVYPLTLINSFSPAGVHHNHKFWEMELVVDSDWLPDNTAPLAYWAYTQDVKALGGVQPALVCNDCINYIEWLKVYIREADGTQTCLTYANAEPNVVWCVGDTSDFRNEQSARHQTKTFKFICLQDRGKAQTAVAYAKGANEAAVKYLRIKDFTVGANVCTNILAFKDELVLQVVPQFVPNTFQGVDIRQDFMWRLLTVTVDSETSIFDPYFTVEAENPVFAGNFYVEHVLADGAGTVERWAYSASDSRIVNRSEGRIDADSERDTIDYQILTKCTKTITHP